MIETTPPETTPAASEPVSAPVNPVDLVPTETASFGITIGLPRSWTVLRPARLSEVQDALADIDPALADLYSAGDLEELAGIDLASLPARLSSIHAGYFCDSTPGAAARLEWLRGLTSRPDAEGSIVDLPAGQAATVSYARTVGPFTLLFTTMALSAPTLHCGGTLLVTVIQSEPEPALVDAIARSIDLGFSIGSVTLEVGGAVALPPTDLNVVCERRGEADETLAMSSLAAGETLHVDLEVDASGQPIFFQFATGDLMVFSGKGWDARDTFRPEHGSTREQGSATFENVTPPDDSARALSGRISWACAPA